MWCERWNSDGFGAEWIAGSSAGSAIKEKSVTISPGYLEQLGTLDKDFNLKYKPDYKIYSNEIMIERRYHMDLRKTQK